MFQAETDFVLLGREGRVVSRRRTAPMRGRGQIPNEVANLVKRESGFKFHVFDQERRRTKSKVEVN